MSLDNAHLYTMYLIETVQPWPTLGHIPIRVSMEQRPAVALTLEIRD